jgi:hypothetical protein
MRPAVLPIDHCDGVCAHHSGRIGLDLLLLFLRVDRTFERYRNHLYVVCIRDRPLSPMIALRTSRVISRSLVVAYDWLSAITAWSLSLALLSGCVWPMHGMVSSPETATAANIERGKFITLNYWGRKLQAGAQEESRILVRVLLMGWTSRGVSCALPKSIPRRTGSNSRLAQATPR